MTVCKGPGDKKSEPESTKELNDLFYESVSLSEKLSRYVDECQVLLTDEEFRRERDSCQEVLDMAINQRSEDDTESEDSRHQQQPGKMTSRHEMTTAEDDDHVTEELTRVPTPESSLSSGSDLELSDELTEVSSTDSLSGQSDKDSIELEIDDYNFKDCEITRKVNPRRPVIPKKPPPRRPTINEKTKEYLDKVEKKVSCKCCRSVMGSIVHEVRKCERAVNLAKLQPYQPKTTIIRNVREAIEFQVQYEEEWYAAILIQRAWRSFYSTKVKTIRRRERIRLKNDMRLKYGHIAGFVLKREAEKRRQLGYY